MDLLTAQKLNDMNARFYADNAASFSATRADPWPGWERLAAHIDAPRTVIDLGSGNLRFERFLAGAFPGAEPEFYCVDSCDGFGTLMPGVHFQQLDFVRPLVCGESLRDLVDAPLGDLVVSFGVMHHVPGVAARKGFLRGLAELTRPGGYLCVSFWRFMEDAKLAAKAHRSTSSVLASCDIALDEGDYILGWQDVAGAMRYCHHFSDDEIEEHLGLLAPTCELVDRFDSDGRTGALNTYAVLKRG